MRISRAQFIAGACVALVVAGTAFMARPKPLLVDAATVSRQALESTIDADGRTRVRERYVVVAPVAGRVERISRLEGSSVRAGDVLARIAPAPLDSQTAQQAQARVDAASALVVQAAAQARIAVAELDQRSRELSRAKRLAEVGGVAPRMVEECELAQLQADEARRGADQRVRAAEADARQARATLAGREGGNTATALVRAPANGVVLRIAERSERIVAAGTPLLELGDPASLEIVADLLSSDAAAVHIADRVRLTQWNGAAASGNVNEQTQMTGTVREIEPSGFTKISALGVEEQRVNVVIDAGDVPRGVGDGFRVDVSIIVWSAANVVAVPRSALLQPVGGTARQSTAGWSAFVIKAGRVQLRQVRIGHQAGTSAEVLSGLEDGDEVVLFPSDQVKAGIRVRARTG